MVIACSVPEPDDRTEPVGGSSEWWLILGPKHEASGSDLKLEAWAAAKVYSITSSILARRRHRRDPEATKDVAHEALARLGHSARFDPQLGKSFLAFLYGVVLNVVREYEGRRDRDRDERLLAQIWARTAARQTHDPAGESQLREAVGKLREAVSALNEYEQELLRQRFMVPAAGTGPWEWNQAKYLDLCRLLKRLRKQLADVF